MYHCRLTDNQPYAAIDDIDLEPPLLRDVGQQ